MRRRTGRHSWWRPWPCPMSTKSERIWQVSYRAMPPKMLFLPSAIARLESQKERIARSCSTRGLLPALSRPTSTSCERGRSLFEMKACQFGRGSRLEMRMLYEAFHAQLAKSPQALQQHQDFRAPFYAPPLTSESLVLHDAELPNCPCAILHTRPQIFRDCE